ncbi:MAG: hypothetical protein HY900_27115 [Deltaproteobacteria bacterium]|nr:hypothetical protein [Deltaproteobacteria bacterium]
MSEEKMGTQYAREIAQLFRETAGECKYPTVAEKLTGVAGELETLAGKLYFKTQKGTEDMQKIASDLANFRGALAACNEAGAAQSFCLPVFARIEPILQHVKTMKVRMT